MSILWLNKDNTGKMALKDDPLSEVLVLPEQPDYIRLPESLGFGDRPFSVCVSVKAPCFICGNLCTHMILEDCDIRVATCFEHDQPYMFYRQSNTQKD